MKPIPAERPAKIYFTDFFQVDPDALADYGAFNISPIVDLPLFIDPFLLFTSSKPEYQELHKEIIKYLRFLRDRSIRGNVNDGLLKAWYCFKEVHQNCLGFCINGTHGAGLGMAFARALNSNLNKIFSDFGKEQTTKDSHLEKLVLIKKGVAKDNISDFTTNLIKKFLAEYTQTFAVKYIDPSLRKRILVPRVSFNYDLAYWEDAYFDLPYLNDDYLILTPEDILTKDDTWINKEDLHKDFPNIREAIPNDALRAQVENYFLSVLPKDYTKKEEQHAVGKTLLQFPELIDHFIRQKEDRGNEAIQRSIEMVKDVDQRFIQNLRLLVDLIGNKTDFYKTPATTLEETKTKINFLKQVIENQDGYRIFYLNGKAVQREKDLQILFKLVWEGSPSSVDTEVNNGRGPVDFKVSRGSKDQTLVEFKLASNTQLEKNLANQVAIYEKANCTTQSYKVILYFNDSQHRKVTRILKNLKQHKEAGIILIDAGKDKPSASKAN